MSHWIVWLNIALELAMPVAFIAVYEGARRLASNGLTRKAALMLAGGLLLPVYEGGVSLTVPGQVRQQMAEQAALRAPEPAGGWEKQPGTPEQRMTMSLNAATINYMVSGRLNPTLDASGARVTYAPSQQQVDMREELVRDQKGAEDSGQQFLDRGVRLFRTAAISLLFGLIVGYVQRRRARHAGRVPRA